jgi:hypothetical protein
MFSRPKKFGVKRREDCLGDNTGSDANARKDGWAILWATTRDGHRQCSQAGPREAIDGPRGQALRRRDIGPSVVMFRCQLTFFAASSRSRSWIDSSSSERRSTLEAGSQISLVHLHRQLTLMLRYLFLNASNNLFKSSCQIYFTLPFQHSKNLVRWSCYRLHRYPGPLLEPNQV